MQAPEVEKEAAARVGEALAQAQAERLAQGLDSVAIEAQVQAPVLRRAVAPS